MKPRLSIFLWIACLVLIPSPAPAELCDTWQTSPDGQSGTDGDVEAGPAGAPGTGYVMDDSPWNLEIHPQSVKFFPFVPVILERRGGRFVHACRDFAGAYDRFIRGSLMQARRRGRFAATALSEAFFSYL